MSFLIRPSYWLVILFLFNSCESIPFLQESSTEKSIFSVTIPQIEGAREKRDRYEFIGKEIIISSDHPLASQAGMEVWKQGGNVVDVFTASSFAISVLRPHSTGLLGGGFAVVYLPNKGKWAYDFRERSPKKGIASFYLNEDGTVISGKTLKGAYSAAVPGNVQGILQIQKQHGKLPLSVVLAPALRYARSGFSVYGDLAGAVAKTWSSMNPPMQNVFGIDKRAIREGELLIQEELAKTLERIIQNDKLEFLEGETIQKISEYYTAYENFITIEDFKNYQVKVTEPLTSSAWGHTIFTMPPPSSGVHLVTMMNLYSEMQKRNTFPKGEVGEMIRIIEAMRVAYRDRVELGGDPLYTNIPVTKLLSQSYAKEETNEIEKKVVSGSWPTISEENKKPESYNTTHISILDKDGNAVSTTQSVNGIFGAGQMVPGTGLVLNNTMDDFAVAPGVPNLYGLVGSKANAIEPGKTPLSSMSPVILTDNSGKTKMVIGAPGGSQIPTSIFNTLYRYLIQKEGLYESVSYPRIHHQFSPDRIFLDPEIKASYPQSDLPFYQVQYIRHRAKVFAVAREGDSLIGVSDPKGEGVPLGF
ncbi:gamma-glutamyltransferase [Leptospira bandrabouensis]|uniref:gamma-glutamyltransferase n=1 Tax=Leptospira bandrabouensis TaxID=2484903 RepID=UPI00223D9EE3|nr:gamma-glutamyltransferase [Leptospira bandrabouensis]MCW7458994.1 gamma-glutamyltransferase [Leptospira bandrabouensis]MCW7478062.1 gamma-glutamyltransferase [Leptospira bandrabouensis]MCW7485816.1 gamma-glutamyltransferase [Leptospira bandrabouensis]